MPFRIENILKKDDTCGSCKLPEPKQEFGKTQTNQQGSILQQTLQNRLQPHYHKAIGEEMNADFQPYPCDRFYYPSHIYNPYVANDYSYTFGRKYYSMYTVPSSTIFSALSKKKGGQVRFTPNQTDILEKRFMSNKYLTFEDRKRLAETLKLSDRQVKTWFQNRRAKWRRSTSSSSSDVTDDNKKVNEQSKVLNIISNHTSH